MTTSAEEDVPRREIQSPDEDLAPGADTGRDSGLRWMYLLIVVALAGIGAGAAQILFYVHDLGHVTAVQACLLDHGIRLSDPASRSLAGGAAHLADFATCANRYNRRQGTVMVAGITSILVLAWALMILSGTVMRRRLRSGVTDQTGPKVANATARFDHWCDIAGLTDRHRPRLLLARPGRRTDQAFTTALPFGRPTVVIPVSYAYLDPAQLDLVVLHELAHVRARDLTWASATWWAGWLNLPVLLAAILPLLTHPSTIGRGFRSPLLLAVVLSLVTLTLRSAVLRRREQAADTFAVRVLASPDALRVAAGAYVRRPPNLSGPIALVRRLRRWTSTHPSAEVRAETTAQASDGWEGGFVVAAATGILSIFTFQSLDTILIDLSGFAWPWADLPSDLSLATAALVWAVTLIPAWIRHARVSRGPGPGRWWPTVAGSALGLLAGYLLPAPGTIVPEGAIRYTGVRVGPIVWIGLVGLGVSLTGIALARAAAVAAPRRRIVAAAAATLAATVTLVTALATASALLIADLRAPDRPVVRVMLIERGGTEWYQWVPAFVLLCLAVLAALARRPVQATWSIAVLLTAVVTGAAVAIITTQIHIHQADTPDAIFVLMSQRQWICAITGWVCAMAILVSARPHTRAAVFPIAVLVGAAATVLTGIAQYGRDVIAGRSGHSLHNAIAFVRTPLWLLFVLVVMLVAACDLIPGQGRRQARPSRRAAVTAIGVLAMSLTVATGSIASVTIARGDWSGFPAGTDTGPVAAADTPSPIPVVTYPPGTADPGRLLTSADAAAVLAGVRTALPSQWKPAKNAPDSPNRDVQPVACAAKLDHDAAVDKTRVRVAERKTTLVLPASGMPPLGATLVTSVISFASPSAATGYVDDASTETVACPRWSTASDGTDDGRDHLTMRTDGQTGASYPGYRLILTEGFRIADTPAVVTASQSWVVIGHNVVSAEVVYSYLGATAAPATRIRQIRSLVETALTCLIDGLRRSG